MAEAAVQPPSPKFFCHKCFIPINPVLPDFVCPQCRLGFIEEYAGNQSLSDESDDEIDPAMPDELFQVSQVLRNAAGLNHLGPSGNDETWDGPFDFFGINFPPQRRSRRRRYRQGGPDNNRPSATFQPPGMDRLLQLLLTSLTEGRPPSQDFQQNPIGFLTLHANPGDYVWGRGNFDAIITQLLNQLDGTGPPPLAKEKIEEIPTVTITQEQVDKNLQCTVCMEDFLDNESVRRLKCEHHFHSNCITPWLELHGTCPICRTLLNESEQQGGSTSRQSETPSASENNFTYRSQEDFD